MLVVRRAASGQLATAPEQSPAIPSKCAFVACSRWWFASRRRTLSVTSRSRPAPAGHHRHGHGPVEADHRTVSELFQQVVERQDLRPVGSVHGRGLVVDGRDRDLHLMGTDVAQRKHGAHRCRPLGDVHLIPLAPVLLVQADRAGSGARITEWSARRRSNEPHHRHRQTSALRPERRRCQYHVTYSGEFTASREISAVRYCRSVAGSRRNGCSARRVFEGHGGCLRRPRVPMVGYGRPLLMGVGAGGSRQFRDDWELPRR